MSTQEATADNPSIPVDDIENYLQEHPDFFESRPELLAEMIISHPSGQAVSLIEHQIRVLRDKNGQLEHKLLDLVAVARDNEHLSTQLHHLALGLLEAENLDAVLSISQELLRNELKADHVCIRLIGQEEEGLHGMTNDIANAQFADLFVANRPVCGRLSDEQKSELFGEEGEAIASSVLVPLQDPERLGILAVGSHDEQRFHPGMGTLFMGTLGELVSRAIRRHRVVND
jgi:uncharacterized protein YigA (DUF484 family)